MADSRNRKQQVTLFEPFVTLKKARNNTSVKANVGNGTSFIHSDGYESSDSCVFEL